MVVQSEATEVKFKTEEGMGYFTRLRDEYANKIDYKLRALLAFMQRYCRKRYSKDVVITCLLRTPEENARIGGQKNSAHLTGRAADVRTKGQFTDAQISEIEAEVKRQFGPVIYTKYHDGGTGKHLHLNVNFMYAASE